MYNSITISAGTLKGVDIRQLISSYKAVDKTVNPVIITTWQEDLTPEIIQLFEENSIIVVGKDEEATETEFLKRCGGVRNSINLQLFTIKNAIGYIKRNEMKSDFIIKTRNDLYGVNYEKIFDYLRGQNSNNKISVLSFFANPVEKLYFLDHFVAGPSVEMIKFYDIIYCPYQHFYPEHYLLVNYTQSNKFRLNYLEYKKIFNFMANDFDNLGIDFVWDRTGRTSESEATAKNSCQLLIKDEVCMYRELIEDNNSYNFNVFVINFEPTFKNQYYDCYFGVRKNEDFAFELSFAKGFGGSNSFRMFLVSENDTVDLNHPKIYWIKKDITFIDKSLIKVFLRDYDSVFLRIQSDEEYKLFSPFLSQKNIKQITLSNMGDSFYEVNNFLCGQLSYKLVHQDFNKNYFVYLRPF